MGAISLRNRMSRSIFSVSQFRSQRLNDPPYEMSGYQADLGPGYWGSLYDESRRNKTLASPDSLTLAKALNPNAWNEYENKNACHVNQ